MPYNCDSATYIHGGPLTIGTANLDKLMASFGDEVAEVTFYGEGQTRNLQGVTAILEPWWCEEGSGSSWLNFLALLRATKGSAVIEAVHGCGDTIEWIRVVDGAVTKLDRKAILAAHLERIEAPTMPAEAEEPASTTRSGYPTAAEVAAHDGLWLDSEGDLWSKDGNMVSGGPCAEHDRKYGPFTPLRLAPCEWPAARVRADVLAELRDVARDLLSATETTPATVAGLAGTLESAVRLVTELSEVADG